MTKGLLPSSSTFKQAFFLVFSFIMPSPLMRCRGYWASPHRITKCTLRSLLSFLPQLSEGSKSNSLGSSTSSALTDMAEGSAFDSSSLPTQALSSFDFHLDPYYDLDGSFDIWKSGKNTLLSTVSFPLWASSRSPSFFFNWQPKLICSMVS